MAETARYDNWLSQKRMGEGSFAQVFRACNLTNTSQLAAVKVLREEWCSRKVFRERFAEEAQTMEILGAGSVRIPALAAYYGADTDAATPWIAIEYIDGRPLDEVISDGKLPSGDLIPRATAERAKFASQIIRDVCEALAFAHRRGIVHRDVKPENILVARDGRFVIIDFGIARDARGKRHTEEDVPSPMTPDYAAPELLESRVSEHLEPALDVYALGCTLYEILVGSLPTVSQANEGSSGNRYMPRTGALELPDSWPHHLRVLVRAMTLPDAMSRPSLAQIIATLDTGQVPVNMASGNSQRPTGNPMAPPAPAPLPYAQMPQAGAPPGYGYPHAEGNYHAPSGAYGAQPGYPPGYGAQPHGYYPQVAQPAHLRTPSRARGMQMPAPQASPGAPPSPQTGQLKAQVTGNLPPPRKASGDSGPPMSLLVGGGIAVVALLVALFLGMGGSESRPEDDLVVSQGSSMDAPATPASEPSTLAAETVRGSTPSPAAGQSTLQIVSDPPGAVARIAGNIVGTTPTSVSLGPGAYVLTLEHPSYRKIVQIVGANDGEVRVDIPRMAAGSQVLVADSFIEGAKIRIDGTDVGLAPGVFEVRPGRQMIQAWVGGVPRTKEIDVPSGTTLPVRFE